MNPKLIVKYILIWQIAIILVTILSSSLLPLRETFLGGATQAYVENSLINSRANFDGNYFVYIAERGYGYALQAFFPLYPLLIQKTSHLFQSSISAGVAISLLGFSLGAFMLVKLIRFDSSVDIAKYTLLALLFFPVSFYLSAVYTEGLFFFLCVSAFYFARKRNWWMAGIFGGLAAYTKFLGVFLFPSLLVEWWQQSTPNPLKHIKKLIPLLFIPLGLGIYMHYLYRTTGDPLAFYHAQKLFGQDRTDTKIVLIYQVFWRYIKMLFTVNRFDPLYLTIILEFITGIIFLTTSVVSFIKHRASYSLFNLAIFIIPTLTGSFTSISRYVLICFPSFILIGSLISKTSSINKKLIAIGSGIMFFIFLSLFVRGYWVA